MDEGTTDESHVDAYEAAAVAALADFAVEAAEVTLVSVAENITYRIDTAKPSESLVLRLHRPGYHSLAELDSERVWLHALSAAGIAVPEPRPTVDGRYYVPVEIPGLDERRFVGLSTWIEGEIVAELDEHADASQIERNFRQLGSLMAAMHNQAGAWAPPSTFRRHRLDADAFMGEAPFWGRFWDHPTLSRPERHLLMAKRDALRAALERYGDDQGTFTMIHADLHFGNLVVDEGSISVIDFDDAGFGWHQYDIAVAMFGSRDMPNFDGYERSFIDAYRDGRDIADEDLALVPMFELIRGMALIGWKAQRPEVRWPAGRFDALKGHVLDLCATIDPPC